MPGKRIGLATQDLNALGAHQGGIDERWFASTTRADNGPETREDEGLSYVVGQKGERFLLLEPLDTSGAQIISQSMMNDWNGWPLYCKFFDNMGPIPQHLHQFSEHVEPLGKQHKPEAFGFSPQLNPVSTTLPCAFFELEPGTTREDIYRYLECRDEGDNGVLGLSKTDRLTPGTGWLVPPGILHAPGSLCSYEVQWGSGVLAMYQSLVERRYVPWDLLVKDLPEDKKRGLDYTVGMIDWNSNVNSTFKYDHYLKPMPVGDTAAERFQDSWVIYGRVHGHDHFSAKELTVQSGAEATIRDNDASGARLVGCA